MEKASSIVMCEQCKTRLAEHRHHIYSQGKRNRGLYGDLVDSPLNIMHLCSICHENKPIEKMSELEFCRKLKIKPRSKELLQKIQELKIEKFWRK